MFQAPASETILQAAGRCNVVIPCGCGGGMCGTCRLRLRTGSVRTRHAGGLSADEEAAGWILACSSRPRSDLVLDPDRPRTTSIMLYDLSSAETTPAGAFRHMKQERIWP